MTIMLSVIMIIVSCLVWRCTSQYLDSKDKGHAVRSFILVGILTFLMTVIYEKNIVLLYNIWAIVICILYLTIPIIYFISNKNSTNMNNNVPYIVIDSRRDILLAVYVYLIVSAMEPVLRSGLPMWLYIIAYSCLSLLFISVPLLNIIHYKVYGEELSESSMLSIQQTRWQETREYLYAFLGKRGLAGLSLIIVTYISVCMYCGKYMYTQLVDFELNIALIYLICMTLFFIQEFPKGRIMASWISVKRQLQNEKMYKLKHDERYSELKVDTKNSLINKLQGTVIVVIGESASREYMHVYNKNMCFENTPWLESKENDDNFLIYNNVYASYNLTVEVLRQALTESSQYNNKEFSESVSIIDIARKAGYHTYWFSHQGRLGQDNVATTMIAQTANTYKGPLKQKNIGYDKELLELLQTVNPKENNFIVFHLMGSHAYYEARYPKDWTVWKSENTEAYYSNTILYTDEFLQELFQYATDNLNLQSMLYFSDHGENLQYGHHPSIRTADTLEIPMFIYLSEKYREAYVDRVNLLKQNKTAFYSNDMLYNTIVGLLEVKTSHYSADEDLGSKEYSFGKNDILTFGGTSHIYEFD
ncbi:phosphoethanolamine transferase [Selenomonas ruminantium]|uniref:phosphoethanolamine transferase n=1 Tax=Selenomonas ruminantium TaxID=971 RepID=UPI0026F133A1|nr:phosphoethanolamine transferase [Selenomonas ruminantium]